MTAFNAFAKQLESNYASVFDVYVQVNRPNRLTQCCTQFTSPRLRFFVCHICIRMWHSHLNDKEIPETKRFIPKGFELGTTLS